MAAEAEATAEPPSLQARSRARGAEGNRLVLLLAGQGEQLRVLLLGSMVLAGFEVLRSGLPCSVVLV